MTGTTELPDSEMSEITIDLQPMLGRVAVAPAGGEAFGGLWPGNFGGNMDAPEVREGATVFLPVLNDGAYFYFGDGHARQGEGEVAGSGLETSMDVELRIDLIKGKKIDWPRLEDDNYIMVAGSARPLIDAFRLAHVELIEWMESKIIPMAGNADRGLVFFNNHVSGQAARNAAVLINLLKQKGLEAV